VVYFYEKGAPPYGEMTRGSNPGYSSKSLTSELKRKKGEGVNSSELGHQRIGEKGLCSKKDEGASPLGPRVKGRCKSIRANLK